MLNIDLSGQTALITGGASGIGLAITGVLGQAGADCMVLDRDPCPAEVRARSIQVDLSDPDELTACLDQIDRVNIVVNNAGILGPPTPLEKTPADWFESSWAVNLRAPMLIARELLPRMRASGGGCMINVSSISAFRGSAADPAYAAAKAGLIGLTRSLAAQYGRFGIRVLAVCPGSVSGTRLLERSIGRSMTREEVLGVIARLPLGRMVTTEQVAHLVAFLASPLASALTGISITIDAGESVAGR